MDEFLTLCTELFDRVANVIYSLTALTASRPTESGLLVIALASLAKER